MQQEVRGPSDRPGELEARAYEMARSIYAVSDVHGHLGALQAVLEIVGLDHDPDAQLVLLGDYVDRGPDSRAVLELVRDLQQRYGERVVALLGNHDCWMLDWLDADDDDYGWLHSDVGFVTVGSFVPAEVIDAIPVSATGAQINAALKHEVMERHGELIAWLRELPLLYEIDHAIYVHAGVDEEAGELWRAATPDHVFTEKYPASTGSFVKTVIAGHIRTSELHADGSHGVFHDGASHYYIDGAVEKTGRLNLLRFDVPSGDYSWQMIAAPTAARQGI